MLLALSFPQYGHPAPAWVALVPLLVSLTSGRAPGAHRAFGLGLAAGAVYFGGTVYWTPQVMQTFGGLSWPIAVGAGVLLVAYLALYPALFAVITARLCARLGPGALWLAPATWVATELLRRWVLGGFPWVQLGSSQAGVIPIVQVVSLAGVYGLSAVVALGSVGVTLFVNGRGRTRWAAPVVVAALVAGLAVWGTDRATDSTLSRTGTPLRVAMVQGNVLQDEKWEPSIAPRILETYLELTRRAAGQGARLVVWPESSTPFYYEHDVLGNAAIRTTVRDTGVTLLFGSDQYEAGSPPRYFNSAFVVRPDGSTAGVYRKMHLVPFGEYVPLKRLLFFVSPLVENVSDFSPGTQAVVVPIAEGLVSTAICYEVVYPDLIARFVDGGSQLLTTITNDAWYGRSSAPQQHFWQASLRAVEQGRYLVRAANTGISGIVDPYGRVVVRSPLFERGIFVGDVRLLHGRTFYGRTGDGFAYACLLAVALAWAAVRGRARAVPGSR
ncbi:MAG: apolipoprotein N-acyltransferase [Acidobacteriota bacterium]